MGKILHSETLESNHSVSTEGEIFQRWNKYVIARVNKMTMKPRVL